MKRIAYSTGRKVGILDSHVGGHESRKERDLTHQDSQVQVLYNAAKVCSWESAIHTSPHFREYSFGGIDFEAVLFPNRQSASCTHKMATIPHLNPSKAR